VAWSSSESWYEHPETPDSDDLGEVFCDLILGGWLQPGVSAEVELVEFSHEDDGIDKIEADRRAAGLRPASSLEMRGEGTAVFAADASEFWKQLEASLEAEALRAEAARPVPKRKKLKKR
jgi:hypothetical protein